MNGKCTQCGNKITPENERYLDESGVDGAFCSRECIEKYILHMVETVAAEDELDSCWNCGEDEETQTIGDDGLCESCRDLYSKDGTTFERCGKCCGLIEYGGKDATKQGDACTCT